jgi:hypothetical protein
MLQEIPASAAIAHDDIISEVKGVPFPLSQFNLWEATLLTDQAIQTHLALLQQAIGSPANNAPSPREFSQLPWPLSAVAEAWQLAQRINPTSPNQHLAWRSAEQIFRFGMAHNRSSYFLTPYHSLFFSWELFGTETLPIYAREGAFLCQRFHPEETHYHLTAYYVGVFLYQAIKNSRPASQHPTTSAYLQKLVQWARENGAQNLLRRRVQRQADTQSTQFTSLQTNLWLAAYAAYTQDPQPLIELTLQASKQLGQEQLVQMGEKLQGLPPC